MPTDSEPDLQLEIVGDDLPVVHAHLNAMKVSAITKTQVAGN